MHPYKTAKSQKFILTETEIRQIVDFRDSGVFKDATNYPRILIFQRNKATNKILHFTFVRVRAPIDEVLLAIKENFAKDRYKGDYYDIFSQAQNDLMEDIWNIMPEEEKKVFDKIELSTNNTLGTICKVFTGVQTGADKIFLLQQSKINDIKIEKNLLKPFLKGRDVRKWKISWRGMHLLFPHMQENSTIIAIPESELRTEYLQTFNYLETSKEKLKSRKWFGKTATDIYGEWYALMYSVNPAMFEQPKLMTPAISDKNNFTYDLDGYYFSVGGGTIYGISLVGDIRSERNYYYLLGILNSNAVEFYFKHISSVLSGGYYEYHSQYLERLPICLPQTPAEQNLADEITKKVTQL